MGCKGWNALLLKEFHDFGMTISGCFYLHKMATIGKNHSPGLLHFGRSPARNFRRAYRMQVTIWNELIFIAKQNQSGVMDLIKRWKNLLLQHGINTRFQHTPVLPPVMMTNKFIEICYDLFRNFILFEE